MSTTTEKKLEAISEQLENFAHHLASDSDKVEEAWLIRGVRLFINHLVGGKQPSDGDTESEAEGLKREIEEAGVYHHYLEQGYHHTDEAWEEGVRLSDEEFNDEADDKEEESTR